MIPLLLALAACATEEATDSAAPTVDCGTAPEGVTWDGFAHGFMITYCTSCHSVNNTENRYGAPEGIDLDSEQDVYDLADRVRVRVLEENSMPIGGGVYEDDLYLLDVYLTCRLQR